MKLSALHDLYVEHLRELYDSEQQLRKALAEAAEAAQSPELKGALEEHLDQGEEHGSRIKEILDALDENTKPKRSLGMAGLIAELHEVIEESMEAEVRDAAIIAVAQRIEHYEIAAYGCVCAYAHLMGLDEDADLLQETLDEEKEADEVLTDIADSAVNQAAHMGEEEGDEDEEESGS